MSEGQGSAGNALVPLAFELGEAFRFDWNEEGVVIGGIDYRVQVSHMNRCSHARWGVWRQYKNHQEPKSSLHVRVHRKDRAGSRVRPACAGPELVDAAQGGDSAHPREIAVDSGS
ncbi:MAG: hypothetical protein PHO64_06565 [Thiomonas sp.]|nr:hypothetical protein [Thiomonas sp.]